MPALPAEAPRLRWYQGLERYCWIVLGLAALGWLFDTMDQNLFNLVGKDSVRELLTVAGRTPADAQVTAVRGWVTAAFLVGWSVGGFAFGILGDRIGRTGTMVLTILIYAAFTGVSGLVHTWPAYAGARFMTGLGVGGEWAAGAAIVAEVFPERSRPMALGTLQALSAVGNMLAAVITFTLASVSWRWAYFVGAAPALLVFFIRRSVKEPERWQHARAESALGKELGSVGELFRDPELRRNTVAALLMAVAGQAALWGIAFWSADFLTTVLAPLGAAKEDIGRARSVMFFIQQIGAAAGVMAFAAFSERTNRRTAFAVAFALSWLAVPAFFWGTAGAFRMPGSGPVADALSAVTLSGTMPAPARAAFLSAAVLACLMGFATLGPFSGYTVYFPELFPTRLRATGCGVCYNGARFLAAVAPVALGALTRHFGAAPSGPGAVAGGMPMAATVVACVYVLGFIGAAIGPETKGKPLPE